MKLAKQVIALSCLIVCTTGFGQNTPRCKDLTRQYERQDTLIAYYHAQSRLLAQPTEQLHAAMMENNLLQAKSMNLAMLRAECPKVTVRPVDLNDYYESAKACVEANMQHRADEKQRCERGSWTR